MNTAWILAAAAVWGQTAAAQSPMEKQRASLEIQRQSVQRQAASAAAWLVPWGPAPEIPVADAICDPVPDAVVEPLIESAAKTQQVEPKLLRAVIEQESAFRACAVSPKGAKGLMQLMPAKIEELEVRDPFDPKESIEGGARFLKQLLERYKGDLPQALGAYNAGPAAVDQAGGVPNILETRGYVDAILQKMGLTRTVQPSSPKPKPTGN